MPFFSTVDNSGLKLFLLLSVYVCMICIKAHVSRCMRSSEDSSVQLVLSCLLYLDSEDQNQVMGLALPVLLHQLRRSASLKSMSLRENVSCKEELGLRFSTVTLDVSHHNSVNFILMFS